MHNLAKYFFVLWAVIAVISMFLYISNRPNRFLLITIAILLGLVVIGSLRERFRRKREGYNVYRRGGVDDGILVYDEAGKTLKFYFSRRDDTIYLPTDSTWIEVMPEWARQRKDEIVSRIQKQLGRRLIGRSWSYQASDRKEHLMEQV